MRCPRPVSLCSSGRDIIDDVVGNQITVIGLALHRGREHGLSPDLVGYITEAAAEIEEFLRELSSCHGCEKCAGINVVLDIETQE